MNFVCDPSDVRMIPPLNFSHGFIYINVKGLNAVQQYKKII